MSRPSYETAYADHRYLWETHGSAYDMTGGYVDQDDLALMLKKPSKATARDCLINQIEYWFLVGPDSIGRKTADEIMTADPRVFEIAQRYGVA